MTDRISLRAFALFGAMAFATHAGAGDWPQFRGPHGNGHADGEVFPAEWGSDDSIKWKTPLPEPGNGSPIVSAGRVFVTCTENQGRTRSLFCFDRGTGRQLWVRTVEFDKVEKTHKTNPHGSSTPATNGQRIVVWHGSAGLYCYDLSGQELWSRDLGAFQHIWGYGTSPILLEDRVIMHCGPGPRVFLAAVDLQTGRTLWETDEPQKGDGSYNENKKYMGSWATPVVAHVGGKRQIICAMATRVNAYDPETGEIVWTDDGVRGPRGDLAYSCPILGNDFGVYFAGFTGPAFGFRLGGSGNVTDTHRLWRIERNPQNIGTGVLIGPHVYKANAGPGTLQCVVAVTGEETWQERVPDGNHWGSVIYAAGRLYATNQKGATHVFLPNPERLEIVATNELGESSNSTPAFSEGEIFIRTFEHLYCIADQSRE
ncbi:MAG: PQQ-binding-like beta-propeller repeat protein [Planctomycetes bacterium]|nr:PQQ-binding-like beta-propeller repeat protein [Planctomycetota bacterium]MBL7037155.1 PQQ-binding-like beta-propeller repeat protein [Pirellulaceae bacterium]